MKPTIKVFDSSLTFINQFEDYTSLIFNRHYYKSTKFHIKKTITDYNELNMFSINNFIMLDNNTSKAGIIKGIELQEEEDGRITLYINGFSLNHLLNQRVIIPLGDNKYFTMDNKPEEVIKTLVNNNVISTADANRTINLLTMGTFSNVTNYTKNYMIRYENLLEKISEICEAEELGNKIIIDYLTNKLIFTVYKGTNRNSSSETPVIFSPKYDNIINQSYINDTTNYKNFLYIGGNEEKDSDGFTTSQTIVEKSKQIETGLNRYELFLSTSNDDEIDEKGNTAIEEYEIVNSYAGEILDSGSFSLDIDYSLGDIVTVKNSDWEIDQDVRVIHINETYEERKKVLIELGKPAPTIGEKINQMIRQKQ